MAAEALNNRKRKYSNQISNKLLQYSSWSRSRAFGAKEKDWPMRSLRKSLSTYSMLSIWLASSLAFALNFMNSIWSRKLLGFSFKARSKMPTLR